MTYEKWKDKRKNSASAQLSGGKRGDMGKTWESKSPQDQGFNCNLNKKWASVGRLQSGGSKGVLGIPPRNCYLNMSVCTYLYMCTDVSIIQ